MKEGQGRESSFTSVTQASCSLQRRVELVDAMYLGPWCMVGGSLLPLRRPGSIASCGGGSGTLTNFSHSTADLKEQW